MTPSGLYCALQSFWLKKRDLLLPKLVSGEIDVSDLDLDAVLEGAAEVSPSSLNEAQMVVLLTM